MDDVFFRDLIGHAMRCGAQDACVDEDRTILDKDRIDRGSVSQQHIVQSTTTLYIKTPLACVSVRLNDFPSSTLAYAKKRVDEALSAAHLIDAWSMTPDANTIPPRLEDDTYRYIDPFDDDPEASQKKRRAFDAFIKSKTSVRAPLLMREFASFSRLGDAFALHASQTITRHIQRRITAQTTETAHAGFTTLEWIIVHAHQGRTASIRLPEYMQMGYGIDPADAAEVLSPTQIAQHYAASASTDDIVQNDPPALVLGPWATDVILHETIHQSPYYLGQTDAIAIDSNRGILQCSTPKGSCPAYAIHPTTPEVLTLAQILPQIPDGTLYVDAPTFVTRYSDKTIDITFSAVEEIRAHQIGRAFRPATFKFVPHLFWKNIKLAFGPLSRISMKCQNGNPTFQSPGVWLDLPIQRVHGNTTHARLP